MDKAVVEAFMLQPDLRDLMSQIAERDAFLEKIQERQENAAVERMVAEEERRADQERQWRLESARLKAEAAQRRLEERRGVRKGMRRR